MAASAQLARLTRERELTERGLAVLLAGGNPAKANPFSAKAEW